MMSLEERRALLWFRKHQPTDWPRYRDPDSPSRRTFEGLVKAGLVAMDLKDTRTGEVSRIDVDGGFVAIGHHPATELFRGHLDLDAAGYVEVEPGTTRTSVEGV